MVSPDSADFVISPSVPEPVVHSLSPSLAVTGVRVSEAPGAVGDRMFVIDAIAAEPRFDGPGDFCRFRPKLKSQDNE
ncbi:hypothetical protein AURDEDRAFT_178636 [Auricularia subglabra TFB-10046 SS5]|uniref:Uncharacterized protein n=1 Tax=Auricularia subglabra (strain TFB-10046 / SS5) TaxID=717982 RepID=J0WKM2_AURST|nr:hypothetical protein AURDEDRAFT_178636 [Auricularia subglabra TFB-10046 SS5]